MKLLKTNKKQKGMTMMGTMLSFVIGGFFAYLALLLFPVMISNHTMGNVLSTLQTEPGIGQKSKSEIKSLINKRLRINDIKDVKPGDFVFKRKGKTMKITLDYNNKIPFAANFFILIENHKEVELNLR